MTQTTLNFDGPHLTTSDTARLTGQLGRVFELMRDGEWRTLAAIALAVGGSEAGVSARLRDFRKEKFREVIGCWNTEARRRTKSLWEYRLVRE